ncbi:hypothetical protein EP7_003794 [Isosphaeraceae bacterium EP7]
MSLYTKLAKLVGSWRHRRGGVKTAQRAVVSFEHLDHRKLLAVNFTGNVITDFPATMSPGVVVIPDSPAVVHPLIPALIESDVKVSGLDINEIRVSYTPADDTLSIGLGQPDNQKTGQPVISGDTDNNLDSSSVADSVLAIEPSFIDFPDLRGSETMGAILDLNSDGIPDIVAGIASDAGVPKTYQVADATVNPSFPSTIPGFGTLRPEYAGNVYLVNDPAHPNFEFSIKNFSQLYKLKTGADLTATSTFKVGAFGNSNDDDGISEAYFPPAPVTLGDATPPVVPPPVCPPVSPPILINPHSGRHINTAHPTYIRVSVLGTSGFDVTQIDPATVRFGGAEPAFDFTRNINKDGFLDRTFVFRGLDVDLPPGYTSGTITGALTDGTTTFSSSSPVFNRDESFYSEADLAAAAARRAKNQDALIDRGLLSPTTATTAAQVVQTSSPDDVTDAALEALIITPGAASPQSSSLAPMNTVKINQRSALADLAVATASTPKASNAAILSSSKAKNSTYSVNYNSTSAS